MNLRLWVLNLFGIIGEFLKAIFVRGISDQLNALLPIAYDIVLEIEKNPSILSSDDKRREAISKLAVSAAKASISAATSTLAFAIELAVQRMKADLEGK